MRIVLLSMSLMIGSPAIAAVSVSEAQLRNDEVQHGGGCRKASPPGQCCHAGSKPYHCH